MTEPSNEELATIARFDEQNLTDQEIATISRFKTVLGDMGVQAELLLEFVDIVGDFEAGSRALNTFVSDIDNTPADAMIGAGVSLKVHKVHP